MKKKLLFFNFIFILKNKNKNNFLVGICALIGLIFHIAIIDYKLQLPKVIVFLVKFLYMTGLIYIIYILIYKFFKK